MCGMSQPLHQFLITLFSFIELICLLLEYVQYIVGGVALVKLGGEWMRLEGFPRLLLVFLQSAIEYGLKSREGRGCVAGCGHTGIVENRWSTGQGGRREAAARSNTGTLPMLAANVRIAMGATMALAPMLISAPMK